MFQSSGEPAALLHVRKNGVADGVEGIVNKDAVGVELWRLFYGEVKNRLGIRLGDDAPNIDGNRIVPPYTYCGQTAARNARRRW